MSKNNNLLNDYLDLIYQIDENTILDEDLAPDDILLSENTIKDVIKTISTSKLKQALFNVKSYLKEGNIDKVRDVLKSIHIPKSLSLKGLENSFSSLSDNFNKCYSFSQKVITNSIEDAPPKLVKPISAYIAFRSSYKNGLDESMRETRKNLKLYISRVNSVKMSMDKKDEDRPGWFIRTLTYSLITLAGITFLSYPYLVINVSLLFTICLIISMVVTRIEDSF